MPEAVLTISSKNYSSWCLQGWPMCKLAGLDFVEEIVPVDDPATRAELLLLSPSFLVPCLTHDGAKIWDTLAIGEYLAEAKPQAGLLPAERIERAHCRAVCGEMHSGFYNLRSALPMNLRARHPGFKVWAGAQADIDRLATIWTACLEAYGGPYLFGEKLTMADAKRPGRHPLRHLRCRPQPRVHGLPPHDPQLAGDDRMDRRRQGRADGAG